MRAKSVVDATFHSTWDVVDGMRVHGWVNGIADELASASGSAPLHSSSSPRDAIARRRHVVFVHGLGVSTTYMHPAMCALARQAPDVAVSALDLPGFGKSRLRGRVLSLRALGDALTGWLEVRGIVSPILVGHSHGCQVVVECLASRPALAAALVLNAPTMMERHRTVLTQLVRVALDVPREPLALVPHVVRDYVKAGLRRIYTTLVDALRDRIEDKLPDVSVPVWIVCGDRDPVSTVEWGERLARLTGSRVDGGVDVVLQVIRDGAHAMPFDEPEELSAHICALSKLLDSERAGL